LQHFGSAETIEQKAQNSQTKAIIADLKSLPNEFILLKL
jgi:hypothetical protein